MVTVRVLVSSNGSTFVRLPRAIDRQPAVRFNNVIKRNGMQTKPSVMQSNINRLKNISADSFLYLYHSGLEISPDYP